MRWMKWWATSGRPSAAGAIAAASEPLRRRRLGLIAAGSAAGISAGFGAPIAGLFFAFESILQPAAQAGDPSATGAGGSTGAGALTTESIILSAVLAAVVSNLLLGSAPSFVVPAFDLENAAELPLYLPLGLLCGATAVAFRLSSNLLGRGFNALEQGKARYHQRLPIGRFRYIASRAERRRFARNSVWAFNLAPAFPRGALTLCPQLCMGFHPGDIPKSAY